MRGGAGGSTDEGGPGGLLRKVRSEQSLQGEERVSCAQEHALEGKSQALVQKVFLVAQGRRTSCSWRQESQTEGPRR